MSFQGDLEALTGTAADAFDIKAGVRRCYLYDFTAYPVRLWDGHGVLQAGGYEWTGTVDALDQNRHIAPAVRDARDGTAPQYEFTIPYIDLATQNLLKADQGLVIGKTLTCWHVLCKVGEGLRPTTELRFAYRLSMRGAQFGDRMEGELGSARRVYSASVVAKPLEYGRSKVPAGTMTPTAQRDRARLLGLASDSGCDFVAKNAHRTFTIAGG